MCDLETIQGEEPNILTDIASRSDSGAYRVSNDLILLHNIDFITPLVDDPFVFGTIAAANALSDIFAMGGNPITALNILSYPTGQIEKSTVNEILKGGLSKIRESGALLLGGHSTENEELIYGLCVIGKVTLNKMLKNSNAQPGDTLVLTKPIGNTLVAVSHARNPDAMDNVSACTAIKAMSLLNKYAASTMLKIKANACTDITGFGFLGHLWEMCSASNVGAVIQTHDFFYTQGALDLVRNNAKSSARSRNINHLDEKKALDGNCSEDKFSLLCEAETSGGLLISVPSSKATRLVEEINRNQGNSNTCIVGHVIDGPSKINLC